MQQKTEVTPSPIHPNNNEPNIQNVSPNLPAASQQSSTTIQQPPPPPTQQQSNAGSGNPASTAIKQVIQINPSMQSPLVKLSSNDVRLQQQQMALNSTGSYSQNAVASSSSSNTPSLVVSVPLSTATIPGLNLPPATINSHTTASHMHNSNHFHQHGSGSIAAQQQHRTAELMVSRKKSILAARVL